MQENKRFWLREINGGIQRIQHCIDECGLKIDKRKTRKDI